MRSSRLQLWLTLLAGVLLLSAVLIFAVFALAPNTSLADRPFLLTGFIVVIFLGLVCIAWLLRWLLRPYSQLVGEAKRAPVAHSNRNQNEAEFVLETFQSVIAQLQSQQQELERLNAEASRRADSAEQFSERIVASMPTGLIAFDSSGLATAVNSPARTLLTGMLEGQHYSQVFRDAPALIEMVSDCLSSAKVFRREEIETTNGSGGVARLGATVAPIDPSGADTRGALCLLTDITEVMRLREQVALKKNLESLGEMSAGLAHEFKNAMAALHGYAQLLQNLYKDDQGGAAADALLHEVRNLSEMITSFLNFARPQPLQLEPVLVSELIAECSLELGPLLVEKRVMTLMNATAANLEIQADSRMLRQALLNLIRNGVEAIPETQTERSVAINTSVDGSYVNISIADTGKGIPVTDLQRIFIPFFTTKSQGHGVGLALAHRVITEHGGTLTAGNVPGGGAVFTIRLPT